jgi:hypothetical protein
MSHCYGDACLNECPAPIGRFRIYEQDGKLRVPCYRHRALCYYGEYTSSAVPLLINQIRGGEHVGHPVNTLNARTAGLIGNDYGKFEYDR